MFPAEASCLPAGDLPDEGRRVEAREDQGCEGFFLQHRLSSREKPLVIWEFGDVNVSIWYLGDFLSVNLSWFWYWIIWLKWNKLRDVGWFSEQSLWFYHKKVVSTQQNGSSSRKPGDVMIQNVEEQLTNLQNLTRSKRYAKKWGNRSKDDPGWLGWSVTGMKKHIAI